MTPKELKEIKGEVEGWSTDVRDFHSNNRGSRGIKIDGEWHNVIDKIPVLEAMDKEFPKGTLVKFSEEKNARGYFDVKGKIEIIDKKEAYPNGEPTHPVAYDPNRNKDILFQVAFKAAVELMPIMYRKVELIELDVLCTCVINTTDKLYQGLNKRMIDLKEKGLW